MDDFLLVAPAALAPRMQFSLDGTTPLSAWDAAQVAMAAVREDARSVGGESGFDDVFAPYKVRAGVLAIPVRGVLVRDLSLRDPGGRFTGYGYIRRAAMRAAEDPEVEHVVLDINSPGGEVGGVAETTEVLKSLGKPLFASITGDAASAAYWLACCASSIVSGPSSLTGSIGVLATHVSIKRALDSAGIDVTDVYAGARKLDFAAHLPLSESAKAEIQSRVEQIYDAFVEHVAAARGLPVQVVRDTEARVYRGPEAREIGLVDGIVAAGIADPYDVTVHGAVPAAYVFEEEIEMTEKKDRAREVAKKSEIDESAVRREAAASERERIAAILRAEEAQGRRGLAEKLAFDTEMPVEQAREILAAAPQEAAPAAQAAPALQEEASQTAFEVAMSQQPSVPAAADAGGVDDSADAGEADPVAFVRDSYRRAVNA